jgi:hypothetical protein
MPEATRLYFTFRLFFREETRNCANSKLNLISEVIVHYFPVIFIGNRRLKRDTIKKGGGEVYKTIFKIFNTSGYKSQNY